MKATTSLMVIIVVVILVVGSLAYAFVPTIIDRVGDLFGGLGSTNNAQLVWFANYTDGTSEYVTNPYSVFYGAKAVDYIGFATEVLLTFNAESAVIQYDAFMTMGIDGTPKQESQVGNTITVKSGVWHTLKGASITFTDETVEAWADGVGSHVLFGSTEVDLEMTYNSKDASLSGKAEGTANIEIVQDMATLDIQVKPISTTHAIYPLT